MIEIEEGQTFAESAGTPANAHAKKLAKSRSKKKVVNVVVHYSQVGPKVLKFTSKPGKTISTFIGRLNKPDDAQMLKTQIEVWKKQGLWLAEHEREDKMRKIQEEFEAKAG